MWLICLIFSLLFAISLADRSPGCKVKATAKDVFLPPAGEEKFKGRDVLIRFPSGYKVIKEAPLILAYHDEDMKAGEFENLIDLQHPELKNNAIIIFLSPAKAFSPFKPAWITDPESGFIHKDDSFDSDNKDLNNDLSYTRLLLDHLQHQHCINTRRVFALGLGTGAGVVHQLACHTHLSRRIAAFALVNAAIYRPRGADDGLWGDCKIGRRPIPLLEIHGADNDKFPVSATMEKATSLETLSMEEWLHDWQRLNNCGAKVGETAQSEAGKAVFLTQLENGQMSESLTYGGLAARAAYRCGVYKNRVNSDLSKEEKDPRRITILHYAVQNVKYGWARAKGPQMQEVEFKEQSVKPLGSPNFDASVEILNFFRSHKLPDQSTLHGQAKALLIERGAKKYSYDDEAKAQKQRDEL